MNRIQIWRLIGIASGILSVTLVGFAVYHFTHAYQLAKQEVVISGRTLEVSTASKNELIRYMKKEDIILSIGAASVNLMQNEMRIVFFQSKNDELNALWEKYSTQTGTTSKAFSNIPDTNVQVANIINGDFSCGHFKTALVYERAEALTPWICSMAVPPGLHGSGDFVGFISLFLARELTEAEKARLAEEVAALSASIYKRDIHDDRKK